MSMMRNTIPVYTISLPEYTVESEPDYRAVGGKLDRLIEARFPGEWMALRGIGLVDHPDRSLDDLVATILETGTDQYDPRRKGVHDEMYRGFTIHLHATPCRVTAEGLVSPHYHGDRCPSGSVTGEIVSD